MSRGKDGVVAVVTGAANGIGQAFAVRLAEDGADVAVLDRADSADTVARVEALGRRALAVVCDVSDAESVDAAASAVASGLGRATVLVNAAGVYPNAPFGSVSFADWRRVLAVNLDGMFLVCAAFAPGMIAAGSGRIVNVSSAVVGSTATGFVPYLTSKMGVIGFTRALASDLGGHGVTVNALAPGLTRTQHAHDMWKHTDLFDATARQQAIKRTLEPADLAGTMSFLTSDDAALVTGQTIVVDGGNLRV